MNKKLYEHKWDQEKKDTVVGILGNRIIRRKGVLGIWYSDGTGETGITDPGEIMISESMVGGSIYSCESIEVSSEDKEITYLIRLDESLYSYFWATVIRYIDGAQDAEESYGTYEKVVQAAKDLAERPFNIVRCYTNKQLCCYC